MEVTKRSVLHSVSLFRLPNTEPAHVIPERASIWETGCRFPWVVSHTTVPTRTTSVTRMSAAVPELGGICPRRATISRIG